MCRPRVLGEHQLPEGRDQLQREDHDCQPRLRERDRGARAGFGFEGVLARPSADLSGILNGIDTAAVDAD